MSFILDALKKSENDRQRQSGPGLYEVKVAAPRSQLPYWAIGLIVLLGVNLIIVAWALLRRPLHADAQGSSAAVSAPRMPAPGPVPGALALPAGSAGQPPTANPTAPATAPADTANVQAQSSPLAAQGADAPTGSATIAAPRTAPEGTGDTGANPDDYAPAAEPTQAPGFGFHVKRGTGDGVPLYSQLATAPGSGIPELRLDLHAYAPKPQDRFVLINMKRLHEGDSLPEGVKVENITPDGVILSHNGSRFLLPRE
jgi:general secretion pathway protein B